MTARPVIQDVGIALWRLLPANPIVIRVVTIGGKSLQHLWLRVGYLVVLLFVVLAAQLANPTAGSSLASLAKNATQVFESISILQLAMICLLAPVFTAGAISQEKDAETFNVLLTTPLTNAQIVLGSLVSRLFFVIVLLISGLPIFCITMLFGGVTAGQIFLSFGIAGCTALLTGAIAILISVIRLGTRTTVFSFYAGIGVFLLAGLALGNWSATHVPESLPPGSTRGMTFLAPFHPVWALWVALQNMQPPEPGLVAHYVWPLNRMLAAPDVAYMVLTILASAAIVAFSTLFVRRGIRVGEVGWWTKLLIWRRGGSANGERSRKARRVWANPVAWREAVTRSGAASGAFVRYTYLISGLTAGVIWIVAYGSGHFTTLAEASDWLSAIVAIEFATVILMGVNTAAMTMTRERESGTMELLLTTPLTSKYIVWGKLRGLVSFTLPLLAVPASTVLVAALYDLVRGVRAPVVYIDGALLLPVVLLVYSAFACMLGLYMSLKCTRSVQAVLTSVGILVAVGFGLGLCAFGFMGTVSRIGALVAPMTFLPSILALVHPARIESTVVGAIPVPAAGVRILVAIGAIMAAGLYGAIVAGIYKTMLRDFDITVRKQSR